MPYPHPSTIMRTGLSLTWRNKRLQQFFQPYGLLTPTPQGILWHQQAETQEVFRGLKEAERQEAMSTACSFCWLLKWAAAPALLEQAPKSAFQEQP